MALSTKGGTKPDLLVPPPPPPPLGRLKPARGACTGNHQRTPWGCAARHQLHSPGAGAAPAAPTFHDMCTLHPVNEVLHGRRPVRSPAHLVGEHVCLLVLPLLPQVCHQLRPC
jgi:hypothetical protein